jgi:hypothetical protein
VVTVPLDHCNFRRQLLDPFVQVSHLGTKLIHVTPRQILSIRTVQEHAHGVPRNIRDASRTCDQAKPSESRVLFIGEPDTDHAGAWFQDSHLRFWILSNNSESCPLTANA